MKGIVIQVIFAVGLLLACKQKDSYDPLTYLSRSEQDSIIYKTIRYSAKLAPTSNHQTKFDTGFDSYYKSVAADYTFLYALKEEDGTLHFLIERPGRSITPLYEGIGGNLRLNERDSLIQYEEIFRMWKMPDKDLRERGKMLFQKMIQREDLTIYYPKQAGDAYIEFPDGRFSFDKQTRTWNDNVFNDSTQLK